MLRNLRATEFDIESACDPAYNCLSFVVGDLERPWWPPGDLVAQHPFLPGILGPPNFWPEDLPPDDTVDNICTLLLRLGFQPCPADARRDARSTVTVAVYGERGGDTFAHTAMQRADGRWLSKLGAINDIWHATQQSVQGNAYGTPTRMMCHPRTKEADDVQKAAVRALLRSARQPGTR